MRIWLIGANQAGTAALQQLRKNPDIEVIVSDTLERPQAVEKRVIAQVDYVESVTPAKHSAPMVESGLTSTRWPPTFMA